MKWEEESYSRKDDQGNLVSIDEYEREQRAGLTGMSRVMTKGDLKLYAICGVGFFLDSYDLFIINLVTPIWTYEYWGGLQGKKSPTYPLLLRGAVNAAANIGNIVGQLSFGFLGDAFGRKFVYGKEMIIMIIGVILVISLPNHLKGPTRMKFWYLFGMRILMGIGIGGDYPMSAAIVAERSSLRNRGRMLGWIFSNQGWGTLAGSIVTLILLGCFSKSLKAGHYNQLDAVWRLQIGLALVPAFATLYFRLTMPESKKFQQSGELSTFKVPSLNSLDSSESYTKDPKTETSEVDGMTGRKASIVEANVAPASSSVKMRASFQYFSEWRHLKTLIGTASTWFLVDVAFYGVNLNQSVLLTAIGFSTGKTEYETLLKNGYGNLIIAAAGYVPGYFLTIYFIEILGRRWIQIQGFLVTALMFAIIAGDYNHLGTAGKFVCFTIAQLFFNFGPNATTFIVPGEVFPSRVRGFAHGVSAATGKVGAILSGVLFNYLSGPTKIGVANVLWIFFACSILGAIMTFFFVPESKGVDADVLDFQECQEAIRIKNGH
ncbi:hypothetical protein ABVK25_010721 [Lepraria finkii]|uniref:Major facilitator superfamily (MFS) profile domain-containing protein n=1 Tax=Lepraria finkii TaxID=1340010 RepID=A0ABR4AUU6_9LECA